MRNMKKNTNLPTLLLFIAVLVRAGTVTGEDGDCGPTEHVRCGHDGLHVEVAVAALAGEGIGASQDGGAAQDGGCGSMGQLRCDQDGLHVEVCTRSGAWSHVDHCGVQGAVCVDGRCVGNTRVAQVEDACNVNEKSCSSDCTQITQCSQSNNWVVVGVCSTGTLCRQGACVPDTDYTCASSGLVTCGYGTVGHFFPNLDDCSSYYACTEEWTLAQTRFCEQGYYDPCSSSGDPCTLVSNSPCRKKYVSCTADNSGWDTYVWSNPSKYYTCVYDWEIRTLWKRCEVGYYDDDEGLCVGEEEVCGKCTGSDRDSNTDEEDEELCKDIGKQPVKGNTCAYLLCFADGSYMQYSCSSGYYFDKLLKQCEKGDCSVS